VQEAAHKTLAVLPDGLRAWAGGIKGHNGKYPAVMLNFRYHFGSVINKLVIWLESQGQAALGQRLEREYENAWKAAEEFDARCAVPLESEDDVQLHEISLQTARGRVEQLADLLEMIADLVVPPTRPSTASASGGDAAGRPGANADGSAGPPQKRAWKQRELDEAIRKYKVARGARYAELVRAVGAGKQGAKKAARRMFGRNAIARALGVKSAKMVSNSPAWKAIAAELQIPLARERQANGTRNTKKNRRIGLDMADEEKSNQNARRSRQNPGEATDDPSLTIMNKEKDETEQMLVELAFADKPGAMQAAVVMRAKYRNGEIHDDQVRQIVKTFLDPTE
jgi:hypothetical protein